MISTLVKIKGNDLKPWGQARWEKFGREIEIQVQEKKLFNEIKFLILFYEILS
jgi:hypothetical protein